MSYCDNAYCGHSGSDHNGPRRGNCTGEVTHPDIGISRNDQLRIIGNGVCPQQATLALRFLLAVSEVTA